MALYRAPSPSPYGQRAPSPSPYPPRAPSPSPYGARAPSPYAPSYGPPSPLPQTQALQSPNPGGQVQPGTITYTTSTSPDGRLTYHPFKAVPVSYQTANGIVSGIQWVPAEATSVVPAGAQPANADFMSSWNRTNREDKTLKEWQKDEEHRIRKEEKEAAKRLKKEKERRESYARANAPGPGPYGAYSNPMNDLDRQMDGVNLGGRPPSGYNNRSPYQPPIAPPSPNLGLTNLGYQPTAPPGGYPNPGYQPAPAPGGDIYRAPSPFRGVPANPEPTAILSRSRAPSPNPMSGAANAAIYSPRSRAPSPLPGAAPAYGNRSRAPSPLPGAPPPYGQPGLPYPNALPRSPRVGGGAQFPPAPGDQPPMLPPPDGFSRPANLAQSYTFFEIMKIQDMDDFYETVPRMPKVLVPHDVYHEDWIRFSRDVALAWAGKLPTTTADRASRASAVAAELVDLWNNSFFAPRGVEVVLFKGHERRSGPLTGQIERHLPGFGDGSDSDSSDSSSLDSSDLSDDKYGRGGPAGGGYYGSYAADSKRRKAERKAEKKRKHKEKKARRRARERERTYALYISCITPRDGAFGAPY